MSSSVKTAKKSAFSCEACRKRKVKCDGKQPICQRCTTRNQTCEYKLAPTLTYTQRLEKRIVELEEQVKDTVDNGTSPQPSTLSQNGEQASREKGKFKGVGLDERGGIMFHGSTSFFQLGMDNVGSSSSNPTAPSQEENSLVQRERLVYNAWNQRVLETLANTPEPFNTLIQNHWVWINPLFNFIYRPAFTRDMEVLGPYYSHMLLNAMLAHSVRWYKTDPSMCTLLEPYDDGLIFAQQARTLLYESIVGGQARIPTIQTLLLLSVQENSRGNRTQAWLYSGMAFRLVEDMGINIDGQRYEGSQLSDEDVEIRRRLFWSCYFYDKMISLYLGRSPSIQHSHVSPPQVMLDDSAENELWSPVGISHALVLQYPPTPARSISCFMQMCRLSIILNQILVHLYSPFRLDTDGDVEGCLDREGEALRTWWEELPGPLKIDHKHLPMHCPPSHIVTLNCLYHTFKILLYRPILSRSSSTKPAQSTLQYFYECISSATSIIAIFDIFCRSFGHARCVLSLAYSVYTAASIFLLQAQASTARDGQTIRRLEFCIRSLHKVKGANPVIGNSLNLITVELSKHGIDIGSTSTQDMETSNTIGKKKEFEPDLTQNYGPSPISTSGVSPFLPEGLNMDPEDFDIADLDFMGDVSAAFASLEPISATVMASNEGFIDLDSALGPADW